MARHLAHPAPHSTLTYDDVLAIWRSVDRGEHVARRRSHPHADPFMVVAYAVAATIMATILVATIWMLRVIGGA